MKTDMTDEEIGNVAKALAADPEVLRAAVRSLGEQLIEMLEKVDELESMIKASGGLKCPNCGDVGFTPRQLNDEEWFQEQCEFCYTIPDSVFMRKQSEFDAAKLKKEAADRYAAGRKTLLDKFEGDHG